MDSKKISLASYIAVGSMLFGLYFGAGNLIFPVHLGQEAGSNIIPAIIGFLITGVGLPFFGVLAIGISNSNGLRDLASKVSPKYGMFFTILLYLTIGPFFALPRTATVSFEIGIIPFIDTKLALIVFSLIFFILTWAFSMNPSKIMVWIGKVLNPLFLTFLVFMIIIAFISPMGSIKGMAPSGGYVDKAFFTGFLEGYNTMDVLAALAFGIIVVNSIKSLGVEEPMEIGKATFKSGLLSVAGMGIIYTSLALIGAMSVNKFELSKNGGIALTQIANYYFGSLGSVLLAIIVILACLKTAIGLVTACSETFNEMFPNISYKFFVNLFSLAGFVVANFGLESIIKLSTPVLMFLYPLSITLIILAFMEKFFGISRGVFVTTTSFTIVGSIFQCLKVMPEIISKNQYILSVIDFGDRLLPFSDIGMGWVVPATIGFIISLVFIKLFNKRNMEMHLN